MAGAEMVKMSAVTREGQIWHHYVFEAKEIGSLAEAGGHKLQVMAHAVPLQDEAAGMAATRKRPRMTELLTPGKAPRISDSVAAAVESWRLKATHQAAVSVFSPVAKQHPVCPNPGWTNGVDERPKRLLVLVLHFQQALSLQDMTGAHNAVVRPARPVSCVLRCQPALQRLSG